MGEKASIFQTVQIGIETTPMTPVAADLKLLTVSVVPSISVESDAFRALGNKYSSFVTLNKDWSVIDISGKLSYNEVLYLLSSLLSEPTPAQQGATAAYTWTFVSDTDGEDDGNSFTVEQGDANTAWRIPGARVSGLQIEFSRKEVMISGSGLGGELETDVTLTATPSSLTPIPVLPAHVSIYIADTQAGLAAASAITRGFGLKFGLSDKIGLGWPIGQDPVTLEKQPTLQHMLKLATDSVGMGLISTMRTGVTKWLRVKAVGALIADTYYHTFQIDFPVQILSVGKFSDEDGLYLMEYTLEGIHDATWGKSFQIDVTTNVETL